MITNGTAVLGLGDIGPLAAKPVMEGKAVLFKKFARHRCVRQSSWPSANLDKLIDNHRRAGAHLRRHQPGRHQGTGLLLRRAQRCAMRMKIPVFHDDQHGTAIVVGAGVLNALRVTGKDIQQIKLVTLGARALRRWLA